MKTIECARITETVREMCIEATHFLTSDMEAALNQATEQEESPPGKQILSQLQENL